MHRREFVLGGAAMMAPQGGQRIRIAFLGASHPHASAKVFITLKSPDWELVGVYEPDPAVMARYAKAGVTALTRAQVLEDPTIPVVAVESDIPEHAAGAKAALEAGKHIHWEKQPAINMEEFRAAQEVAARKKLLYQIGYMWRHNPGINAALEAARAGWLGEIFFVRGTMNTQLGADMRKAEARFKGGQMFDLAGHMIDPIVRLMGRPERVTPYLRKGSRAQDSLMDNTLAVFEWRRAMGTFSSASMQPRSNTHRTLEFVGTEGTAVVRPIEPPSLHIDLNSASGPYKAGAQTLSYSYTRYVDDFVELAAAVRGERKLPITPEEDLLVQETLLRASGMEG
ncbi:MAG: Gfo/Idh/MocA family oxidoreductase [Acidobacteriia bacterium]|nr:Gfo/Idh/MocA family oxidoreductase [Terriglobia bacterium]